VTVPGTALLRNTITWQKLRHKVSLLTDERENSGFTGFLRLPTQFDALVGPTLTAVQQRRGGTTPLKITVIGCSNGAEAFTISSLLTSRDPELAFRVYAYDINAESIASAKTARYRAEEIYNNKVITEEFVASTFDSDGDSYGVKPHIASRVAFEVGNVLDPALVTTAAGSDVVFAQNFLFHLPQKQAWRALENLLAITRPGSALFLDGTDLDLRQRFVKKTGLLPLDYEIEKIHDEARRARAVGWPYSYWGLEPFLTYPRDWQRRYATIFLVP
jgi:chemotaxis protein methyltransferase CheR